MVFDEQELRQRLEAAADRVGAPRFTAEGLAARIRRRRAKVLALASGSLLAVAAIAVAVPAALSGLSTGPGSAPSGRPAVVRLGLSFTVAVNGQSRPRPKNAPPPVFTLSPGKQLTIRVGVIVHSHAKVTNLWLGVARGAFGSPGPHGQRPPGLRPILAHARGALTPGLDTFWLTWTMPAHLPRGASLSLVAAWQQQPNATIGAPIAELVPPPGSVMSAAQACRRVVDRPIPGVRLSGVERVRLVLTRYANGEPVEPTHDMGTPVPLRSWVWLVEVHAKAIHLDLPVPPDYHPPARPDTDFSVVMNARTGVLSDFGEGNNWPLPFSKAGVVISLPPQC